MIPPTERGWPWTPLIAKSAFDLTPYGEVPAQLRVRGRLFELPFTADPMVIAYNRAMFQAASLPPPAGADVLFDLPIAVSGHSRSWTEAERLAYQLIDESLSARRPWEEALANYLQVRSQSK